MISSNVAQIIEIETFSGWDFDLASRFEGLRNEAVAGPQGFQRSPARRIGRATTDHVPSRGRENTMATK